jgi:hypothetical protein
LTTGKIGNQKNKLRAIFGWKLTSVHPETVDFSSGRGLSVFATAGIVRLFRGLQKSENEALGQKMLFPDEHN